MSLKKKKNLSSQQGKPDCLNFVRTSEILSLDFYQYFLLSILGSGPLGRKEYLLLLMFEESYLFLASIPVVSIHPTIFFLCFTVLIYF